MHCLRLVGILMTIAPSVALAAQQPAGIARASVSRAAPARPASASGGAGAAAPARVATPAAPTLLPGTQDRAFSSIQGNALDSANAALPRTVVRLRDARTGKIIRTQLTDDSGLFTFRAVDPGNYVVELVSSDQSVLAASQMLSVNAGDAVSAVVKLPFRIPPFGGLLGRSASSAAVIVASAAAAGVLALEVSDCVSPPCGNP